jgi:tetratricopeptide (TPR) repeat protein
VEALPSPPPPEPEKAAEKTEPEAPVRAESFDKLVADADRALEHGSNAKAKDLYQKALHLRPAGVQALSGLGFVALDRGQIPVAYEFFKRALSAKPSFGPAVFGMAEIYRARGDRALALNSYQHYLKLSPNGSEAAAARRQISALQASK